jgi:hypothetical protein
MQRNFEPMRKQVESWRRSELTDITAKVVIYEVFVEGRLEAPKHLSRTVHDLYSAWSNHRPWLKPLSASSRKVDASMVCRLPAIIRNRFLGSEMRTFPIRPRNHVYEQSSVLTVRRIHPLHGLLERTVDWLSVTRRPLPVGAGQMLTSKYPSDCGPGIFAYLLPTNTS